jgi:hypothetical protein
MPTPELCHCGKPLHYSDPSTQGAVEKLIEQLGPTIRVTVGDSILERIAPLHRAARHQGRRAAGPGL